MAGSTIEKWVVNASPFICLGKIGHLDWLERAQLELRSVLEVAWASRP